MNKTARVILPIVVLAVGGAIAFTLIKTRPPPRKAGGAAATTLVETITLAPQRQSVVVDAMGEVVPARIVVLQPEVTGRVIWQDPRLVAGGHFKEGGVLLRIDPRNYKLAAAQQRANVQRAEFELKVEQGRVRVAQREWKLIKNQSDTSDEGAELALRKPHLANAEAALEAAKSALERAELDVSRTAIRAPFNGFVRTENVEIGQLVSPTTQLATFVGTDESWVQVSVPIDRLPWIRLPGEERQGSEAKVVQDAGAGTRIERTGSVVRLLADLDPKGRMARIVVALNDPLALEKGGTELPLLVGAYVNVAIQGDALDDVYAVPRTALYQGDSVLLADPKDRLEIRKIAIAWRDSDTVFVRTGLQKGERLITSRVPYALPGLALDVRAATAGAMPQASSVDTPKPAEVAETAE